NTETVHVPVGAQEGFGGEVTGRLGVMGLPPGVTLHTGIVTVENLQIFAPLPPLHTFEDLFVRWVHRETVCKSCFHPYVPSIHKNVTQIRRPTAPPDTKR